MVKYQNRVQKQLEHIRRECAKVKVLKVPREESYEVDMVAKLVTSRKADMIVNIFIEVAEAPCIKKHVD